MSDATTNRQLLTERAYPDSTNLNSRSSIYEFMEPLVDLFEFVLSLTPWSEGASVRAACSSSPSSRASMPARRSSG